MTTIANDHAALRVADVESSTRFYVEVFGAEIMSNPFVVEGAFAESMMEGPAGVRFRLRHLRFGAGVLELFEFLEPRRAAEPVHARDATILHLGFQVDDVEETAARAEAAGGRVLVPVTEWGEAKLAFIADPDGNIIEVADASIDRLVIATIAACPEAAPNQAGRGSESLPDSRGGASASNRRQRFEIFGRCERCSQSAAGWWSIGSTEHLRVCGSCARELITQGGEVRAIEVMLLPM